MLLHKQMYSKRSVETELELHLMRSKYSKGYRDGIREIEPDLKQNHKKQQFRRDKNVNNA